jgi:hypothetical protein
MSRALVAEDIDQAPVHDGEVGVVEGDLIPPYCVLCMRRAWRARGGRWVVRRTTGAKPGELGDERWYAGGIPCEVEASMTAVDGRPLEDVAGGSDRASECVAAVAGALAADGRLVCCYLVCYVTRQGGIGMSRDAWVAGVVRESRGGTRSDTRSDTQIGARVGGREARGAQRDARCVRGARERSGTC